MRKKELGLIIIPLVPEREVDRHKKETNKVDAAIFKTSRSQI